VTSSQENDRLARLAAKQLAADAKLRRWFRLADSQTPDQRAHAAHLIVGVEQNEPSMAVAAGGDTASQVSTEERVLRLIVDQASPGNRWADSGSPLDVWAETNATVNLVIPSGARSAWLEFSERSGVPAEWMFEAFLLGPNQVPDHHREIEQPKPSECRLELEVPETMNVDGPFRVALHITLNGISPVGWLVLTSARD
jgi:hypothetical protein